MPFITPSDRDAIISLCKIHDETHDMWKPDFRRCIVYKSYFIKYGPHGSLRFEYETQRYIHGMTIDDPSAPRVAEVIDYFSPERRMAYLVMELIDHTTPADNALEKVAAALQWLASVPAPAGLTLGSVGGGPARHKLFKHYKAPLLFSSKQALQNYMNKALEWIPPRCRPAEMSFSDDKIIFIQSDMDSSNFFLDGNGRICLIDFDGVALLPESFASHTLHSKTNPFASKVAEYLDWPRTPNLYSLGRAGTIVHMISDRTLGLDQDGLPDTRL
ncbi:hypothetical protein BOTBODRAFT_163481 [Botryobasidium botryosum FD-172 SS1]|uniref:Aminoglycoside phosphotransferase domain-containing protein n=1 Tax=Botryobasidium botryosum (strain FD-172 SS1) TaxID=930990 RepID=A0A067MG48_BOTB1|nr:hypothetical protein BOTBODRAFT_163481 [Botryobasidium botryosum FD-172 SS1]